MSNAAPNETETPHQRKIRLQNERRRRYGKKKKNIEQNGNGLKCGLKCGLDVLKT
jgi:hypothetical protein